MARIPEEVIDEVIRRTDIVTTINQYVTLKRAGANLKGLCPFHSEKTPSFNVHPGKGIYKCFGCGAGGNVVGFLMDIEGWSFPETVRHLAEQHGIDIPEESEEEREEAKRRRDGKKLYLKVMELSRQYFEDSLWSAGGRAAQLYLEERGINEDTARKFSLGYAPAGWSNLIDHLGKAGITPKLAERAGLALPRRGSDGWYDRFRHRIMFPVQDIWSNTLAFSGRVFASDDDGPKYINSPETAFYTKGHQLYGLSAAKQAIQKAEYALLVEGNFDVVALHAQGVDVAVAPLGTALTGDQTRLLSRYCREAIIAFDGDSAGAEATLKAMPAMDAEDIECRVIRFDETDDPDSFVRRHGAEAFRALTRDATPVVAWALDRVLEPAEGAHIERKLQALGDVADVLRTVSNRVAWEHYAQEVSRRLDIEPKLLKEYIQRPNAVRDEVRAAVENTARPMELPSAEFGALTVLLDRPQWLESFLTEGFDYLVCSVELSSFLKLAAEHFRKHGRIEPPILLQHIDHPAFRNTVEKALVSTDQFYSDDDKAGRFYQDCIRALTRSWADRTLREIRQELEGTDFVTQREQYKELVDRQMQVERLKQDVDLKAG